MRLTILLNIEVNMAVRDTGTEQHIKDTAKRVFFAEGKLNATTQDIADAAGVNRTLLNYYFRSKDTLIQQVFKDAMDNLGHLLDEVMESDVPFKQKISNLIDVFLNEASAYPYQETFLVSEINSGNMLDDVKSEKIRNFNIQVQAAMDEGLIQQMNPMHFMMNLFSLMAYPLIIRPLYEKLMDLSTDEYTNLIKERKEIICNMIFR